MVVQNLAYKIDEAVTAPEVIVDDSPLKWCSVTLSDVLNKGKRLEASVFDVEAKQAFSLLTHGKYKTVNLIGNEGPVKEAFYGSRLKRHYVERTERNAIGFLGSSEMLDCKPVPVKFMIDDEKAEKLHVEQGTILISRSGTIGNITYVGKTLSQFLVSEHAIRLRCNQYPGYVYTFLKSKMGKLLICSTQFGAVIQEIEPAHLALIPIPDAPTGIKERINDLIMESYAARDRSNELIDEATSLLVEELHLPDLSDFDTNLYQKNVGVDTFTVRLSKIEGRLDASYHVPIADAIVEHVKKYAAEVTTVGDPRVSKSVILPGRFKRVYVDEGYGRVFIGGKQIYELDPANKKYLSVAHHADRISKQLELHENMILITCSGTIGKVAMVGKHWENWTASQHIIRIVPSSPDIAGYLYVFLSSVYGYPLIARFTYGSVVDEIDDNHVRTIQIPLLKNQATQTKINDLALEANKKRYEAYTLEQKALKIMNNEVIFAK